MMSEYIPYIIAHGITGSLIEKMYQEQQNRRQHQIELHNRYEAREDGVPILTRPIIPYDITDSRLKRLDDKINNMINNPFDADLVDTKIGYIFGNPISYVLDTTKIPNEKLQNEIELFNIRSNAADKDAETGLKAAICGYGARLLYIDLEGKENLAVVDPWETVILAENEITDPTFAFRYYKTYEIVNGERKEKVNAEFYSDTQVLFFQGNGRLEDSPYLFKEHYFGGCPLFGVPNNSSLQGEAEKVIKLIDAYDKVLSGVSDEIEKTKLAYLVLYGYSMDDEDVDNTARTSIIEVPDTNGDVKYLTKNINDTLIQNHLNRLEDNILKFAKSVNFGDEAFAGNASGVALRYKLMALENKSVIMERKFTSALRHQFKLLCNSWAKRGICSGKEEEYLNIWFGFKRNLPEDLLNEAQASLALKGLVSEKTRLSKLSFVDNVEAEMADMELERDSIPPLEEEDGDGSTKVSSNAGGLENKTGEGNGQGDQ